MKEEECRHSSHQILSRDGDKELSICNECDQLEIYKYTGQFNLEFVDKLKLPAIYTNLIRNIKRN